MVPRTPVRYVTASSQDGAKNSVSTADRCDACLDESSVAWGEGKRHKLFCRAPSERDVFMTRRSSSYAHRHEHDQERRAGVCDSELRIPDLEYAHAKLLAQLPSRGSFVGFASLALSSGELPEAAVALVEWPLANQKLVTAADNRSNYADRRLRHATVTPGRRGR